MFYIEVIKYGQESIDSTSTLSKWLAHEKQRNKFIYFSSSTFSCHQIIRSGTKSRLLSALAKTYYQWFVSKSRFNIPNCLPGGCRSCMLSLLSRHPQSRLVGSLLMLLPHRIDQAYAIWSMSNLAGNHLNELASSSFAIHVPVSKKHGRFFWNLNRRLPISNWSIGGPCAWSNRP